MSSRVTGVATAMPPAAAPPSRTRVTIAAVSVAHPATRVRQDEAAELIIRAVGDGLRRQVRALARGTQIKSRAVVLPADQVAKLGSIQERNQIYEREAPSLAIEAARGLVAEPGAVDFLVTSSCTGYMIPGLDVQLAIALGLRAGVARLPITEAGCAGGVVALTTAADRLRSRDGAVALVVATELCSLAFHADAEEGNLTSALLFADGAGAVLLESGEDGRGGLEVVDSCSLLVPAPAEVLGFALTNTGFYPLLSRSLPEMLVTPTAEAVTTLLARHGLTVDDAGFWLVHPGGPRVLDGVQRALGLRAGELRWSWQSLRESGNTSSASILEVLARYLDDASAPGGWGVMIAFGPGVSIELLLLRRC